MSSIFVSTICFKTTLEFWIVILSITPSCVNVEYIKHAPLNATMTVGEEATFLCELAPGAPETLSWKANEIIIYSFHFDKDDYPKGTRKYSVEKNGTIFMLTVLNLEYEDSGFYTCAVMNVEERASLIVLGPVQASTLPPNPVKEDHGRFTCKTKFGGPRKENISPNQFPQLQMSFNGNQLQTKERLKLINSTLNTYTLKVTYHIKFEESQNGQELLCEMKTVKPTSYKIHNITVNVLYPVCKVKYTPSLKQYEVGSTITCMADGNPRPELKWENMGNTDMSFTTEVLYVTENMVGRNVWRCTAWNNINGKEYQNYLDLDFEAVEPVDAKKDDDSWILPAIITIPVCTLFITAIVAGVVLYIVCVTSGYGSSDNQAENQSTLSESDTNDSG